MGEIHGDIEDEDGVIVIRRIHAAYRLRATEEERATVERVHAMHREHCPVYRSICRAIDITTAYELVKD